MRQLANSSQDGKYPLLGSLRGGPVALAVVLAWCVLALAQEDTNDKHLRSTKLVLPESLTISLRHPPTGGGGFYDP